MATAKPTLVLPTGYERQAATIAMKRKLAEAMLKQGINPERMPVHWAQVLGQWAQAWAGKSMDKEAARMEDDLSDQKLRDYQQVMGQFEEDAKTLSPEQMVGKYRSNPWTQDALKPFSDAYGKGIEKKEEIKTFNPSNRVIFDPSTNSFVVNPLWVAGNAASQGLPTEGYATSLPATGLPGQQPQPTMPAAPAPTAPANPGTPVGTIENGYQFMGGDDTDRQNWKKIGGAGATPRNFP